jgi:hypothetical protein
LSDSDQIVLLIATRFEQAFEALVGSIVRQMSVGGHPRATVQTLLLPIRWVGVGRLKVEMGLHSWNRVPHSPYVLLCNSYRTFSSPTLYKCVDTLISNSFNALYYYTTVTLNSFFDQVLLFALGQNGYI